MENKDYVYISCEITAQPWYKTPYVDEVFLYLAVKVSDDGTGTFERKGMREEMGTVRTKDIMRALETLKDCGVIDYQMSKDCVITVRMLKFWRAAEE